MSHKTRQATLRLSLAAALALAASAGSGTAQDIHYVHLDALGNVRALTDQNGNVVERHDYLPFGEECVTGPCAANPPAVTGQPLRFTGKERDPETGLDYFGARYYASKVGRFTTVDPAMALRRNLVDPQSWNRYAYARNNPLRYVDPDGRDVRIAMDNNAVLALNAAIQQAIRHFLGTDRPLTDPRARAGAAVVDVALGTIFPATEGEAAAAMVGSAFGSVRPLAGTARLVKRGPKPKGVGPHNLKIEQRIEELTAEGMEHVNGGSLVEEVVPTPGGLKSSRRSDISMRRSDGTAYRENVGRTRANGDPVTREVGALDDLERATGERPVFTPYDREQ